MRPLSALVIAAVVVCGADDSAPAFRITTRRETDRVTVTVEKNATRFTIRSPIGISHARIERIHPTWTEAVTLRLHLAGLEKLEVTNGQVTIAAAVSIQDRKPVVRVWQVANGEQSLDRTSPFWMDIRPLDSTGQPAKELPLRDGTFEVMLPPALFKESPLTITASWIDFYRN